MQNKIFHILQLVKRLVAKIDIKLYAICLVLSSLIWLVISLGDNYDKKIDFPVEYANFPPGMMLVNSPPKSFSVEVSSKGYSLASVTLNQMDPVKIDLSKIKYRRTKFKRYVAAIATKNFKYNIVSQLELDKIGDQFYPDSLYFIFDSIVNREVPIKLVSDLQFEEGYTQYKTPSIFPPKVLVTGPALTVRGLKYIETDTLSLSGLNSSASKVLALNNQDPLLKLAIQKVKVKVSVEKYSEFSVQVPVKLQSNIPNLKVKTFPAKVTITFNMTFPDYKELTDSSFKVVAVVDSLRFLQQDKLMLEVVRKPNTIGRINLSSESVEYVIIK
jgi:hypothetical protein